MTSFDHFSDKGFMRSWVCLLQQKRDLTTNDYRHLKQAVIDLPFADPPQLTHKSGVGHYCLKAFRRRCGAEWAMLAKRHEAAIAAAIADTVPLQKPPRLPPVQDPKVTFHRCDEVLLLIHTHRSLTTAEMLDCLSKKLGAAAFEGLQGQYARALRYCTTKGFTKSSGRRQDGFRYRLSERGKARVRDILNKREAAA